MITTAAHACAFALILFAGPQDPRVDKARINKAMKKAAKQECQMALGHLETVRGHATAATPAFFVKEQYVDLSCRFRTGQITSALPLDSLDSYAARCAQIIASYKLAGRDTLALKRRFGLSLARLLDLQQKLIAVRPWEVVEEEKDDDITDSLQSALATEVFEQFDSAGVAPLPGQSRVDAQITMERTGEDLVFTMSLLFNDQYYGYPSGEYSSPAVDDAIERFSLLVKQWIFPGTHVRGYSLGTADSQKPSPGLKYQGQLPLEGKYFPYDPASNAFTGRLAPVVVRPGEPLSNTQLAWLRAYNPSRIFERVTGHELNKFKVRDYLLQSEELIGSRYRRSQLVVTLVDFFTNPPSAEVREHWRQMPNITMNEKTRKLDFESTAEQQELRLRSAMSKRDPVSTPGPSSKE